MGQCKGQADVEQQQIRWQFRQGIRKPEAQGEQLWRHDERQPDGRMYQEHGQAGHDGESACGAPDLARHWLSHDLREGLLLYVVWVPQERQRSCKGPATPINNVRMGR